MPKRKTKRRRADSRPADGYSPSTDDLLFLDRVGNENEYEPKHLGVLSSYLRSMGMIEQVSHRLPLEPSMYGDIEAALESSNFWQEDNTSSEYYRVKGFAEVPQSDAAREMQLALQEFFTSRGAPIIVVSHSVDPEDVKNKKYALQTNENPNHFAVSAQAAMNARGKFQLIVYSVLAAEDFSPDRVNSSKIAKNVAFDIRHEMVHDKQYDAIAANMKISRAQAKKKMEEWGLIPPVGASREAYMSSHIEIDAFGHEFAERLATEIGVDEALLMVDKAGREKLRALADEVDFGSNFREYIVDHPEARFTEKLIKKIKKYLLRFKSHGIYESRGNHRKRGRMVKITKSQLRRIIREELNQTYSGVENFAVPVNYPSYIFERSYATGVLGVHLPLNESYPYSRSMREEIIREQMLYENWWGDDWRLFERAYGEMLKTHSPKELITLLQEGPILDWGKDLLKKGYEKGKEAVGKGIEAGKDALLAAKEGIAKFGKEAWNILSAMWLTMKGGSKQIGTWVKSVFEKTIAAMTGKIKDVLNWLVIKLAEWNMPTFAGWAQKGLDFIKSLEDKIIELEGWKQVIAVSGVAVGLKWLWNKVGDWINEFKEKIKGLDPKEQIKDAVLEPLKDWIKETAKEKLMAFGGDALKKIMNQLSSVATGVKPWWDAAVAVAGTAKTVVDALGAAATRFMKFHGPKNEPVSESTIRQYVREVCVKGGCESRLGLTMTGI